MVLANKWDEVVAANFTLNDFKTSMCYSMLTSPQNKPNAVEVECFRVAINNSTTPSERYDYDDAVSSFRIIYLSSLSRVDHVVPWALSLRE